MGNLIRYNLKKAIGLVAGVAASYGLIPIVANVLAVQSGFSYTPVFDISAAVISVITILLAVFVFTVLAAKKIKRLEPIDAIRGIDPFVYAACHGSDTDNSECYHWCDIVPPDQKDHRILSY